LQNNFTKNFTIYRTLKARKTSRAFCAKMSTMNRFVYSTLLTLALPFVPLKLLWRGIKQPAYRANWGERFGFYEKEITKPVIWLHCVSVGETRAAEPLIKALEIAYPQHQIVLTHGTPTGRDASEGIFGDLVERVYLPYDLPFAVNNFLTYFQPKIGLIMETELWFNLIAACKQRQIPLLLLNARLSEKSFNGYLKLGKLAQNGVQSLSAIAAQNADDAARFKVLGAQNISVAGNLKFDVKPPTWAAAEASKLRDNLGKNRTVFLAASTREGEESLIIEAVKDLDILTIIVPRHPQRFDFVADLLTNNNLGFVWRTDLQTQNYPDARGEVTAKSVSADCKFVIGNSMGEMFTYYGACDFCFIGGSLLPYGGQNLIEAAAMGKPILIGEHTFNFFDATNDAVKAGAAIRVNGVENLSANIKLLRDDLKTRQNMQKAAFIFSQNSTGSTDKNMQIIAQFLPV
jgi:3-deoxy-D-manno-octulosonic-acid transferase